MSAEFSRRAFALLINRENIKELFSAVYASNLLLLHGPNSNGKATLLLVVSHTDCYTTGLLSIGHLPSSPKSWLQTLDSAIPGNKRTPTVQHYRLLESAALSHARP